MEPSAEIGKIPIARSSRSSSTMTAKSTIPSPSRSWTTEELNASIVSSVRSPARRNSPFPLLMRVAQTLKPLATMSGRASPLRSARRSLSAVRGTSTLDGSAKARPARPFLISTSPWPPVTRSARPSPVRSAAAMGDGGPRSREATVRSRTLVRARSGRQGSSRRSWPRRYPRFDRRRSPLPRGQPESSRFRGGSGLLETSRLLAR